MNPPTACPICGAYSLTHEGQSSALLAVCDVLCLKALEKIGSRLTRQVRSRHNTLGNRPLFLAHTLFRTEDDEIIDRALKGAWDVVPALLDGHGWEEATSLQITEMLDAYVHDLVVTGTAHCMTELAYRFTNCLGLPVYLNHEPRMGARA